MEVTVWICVSFVNVLNNIKRFMFHLIGNKWQTRRKILTPAFHFNILKHFVVTLNEEARYLVTSLIEEEKGSSIVKSLQEFISKHTLNIICG